MYNEKQEFLSYTSPCVYKAENKQDTEFLGRFTLDMLLNFNGFARILTIIARGYYEESEDFEYTRRALLAWCSLPDKDGKKAAEWEYVTDFREYTGEFPNLVNENGEGWLYRHVCNIVAFVKENPDKVSKSAEAKISMLENGWSEQWRKKLKQFQTPIFHPETKGAFVLRFDDILSEAAELGRLSDEDVKIPTAIEKAIQAAGNKDVSAETLTELAKFYYANLQKDTDWVVLPASNFDAYFGTTAFSKKQLNRLPTDIFEKQTQSGICRFRIIL